jgi:hypothetical protein
MAENIEELKQTIDSVIISNGNGQITGQGLNLVLNEMCDILGSTGGGGGGAYQIYIPISDDVELTAEQIAFNAQQFTALESKLQNKEFVQIGIVADTDGGFMCMSAPHLMYGDLMGTGTNSIFFGDDTATYILNSDGIPTMM